MTRQHFQAIAEALRLSHASQETIDAIADVCNRYNPNFDWDKFDVACKTCHQKGALSDNKTIETVLAENFDLFQVKRGNK